MRVALPAVWSKYALTACSILAPSTFLTLSLPFSSIPIHPESATESTGAGHPLAQEELCYRDQYTWF